MATVTLKIQGGSKLNARLAQIASRIGGDKTLSVGFLEGASYPARASAKSQRKASRKAAVALHVAQVAFWNEFGTTRAPPRPFFRGMIAAKSPEWGSDLGKIAKATDYNGTQTLALMGVRIKDQLTKSIVDFSTPANAPSTVKRKGFNDPLIATGTMLRSVDYEVST